MKKKKEKPIGERGKIKAFTNKTINNSKIKTKVKK